jgi:hypothetical protein
MTSKIVEPRQCPVCGDANSWAWGLVRHVSDGAKFVHVKLQVMGERGEKVMVSILKNGVRYLPLSQSENAESRGNA